APPSPRRNRPRPRQAHRASPADLGPNRSSRGAAPSGAAPRAWGLEQKLGQAVAGPVGRAEEVLRAVGRANVEVEVVLPRVADAPVDLDAVLGAPLGRLPGHDLGH